MAGWPAEATGAAAVGGLIGWYSDRQPPEAQGRPFLGFVRS